MMETLENLREQIDTIDYKIHDLLNQRAEVALKVGKTKKEKDGNSTNFYRPEREVEVLNKIREYNKGPLTAEAIANIFQTIMKECRELQIKIYGGEK